MTGAAAGQGAQEHWELSIGIAVLAPELQAGGGFRGEIWVTSVMQLKEKVEQQHSFMYTALKYMPGQCKNVFSISLQYMHLAVSTVQEKKMRVNLPEIQCNFLL